MFFEAASELSRLKKDFCVVTLVSTRGHAPQDPGAKAIVTQQGLHLGTVGGGKVEAKAILLCQELLNQPSEPENDRIFIRKWNLQRDIGMSCGGEVELLFEVNRSQRLAYVVFGAGHIAQRLVPLLMTLEADVTCIDSRQEWLDRLPAESTYFKKVKAEDLTQPILKKEIESRAYMIVMTQGHATDLPVLEALFKTFSPPYVGVIGSKVKAIKLKSELKQMGISPEKIAQLRCPMGLPIGNNNPAEIAISIAAQLLEVRDLQPNNSLA